MNEIKVYKNNSKTVKYQESTGHDFTGATCFLTVAKTITSEKLFEIEGTINTDTLIFNIPYINNDEQGVFKYDITVIIDNVPTTLLLGDYIIIENVKY